MNEDITRQNWYVLVKWYSDHPYLYEIKCYCHMCAVHVNSKENSGQFEVIREGLLDELHTHKKILNKLYGKSNNNSK